MGFSPGHYRTSGGGFVSAEFEDLKATLPDNVRAAHG